MAQIPSANQDFDLIDVPATDAGYRHPAEARRGHIPMAFQITSPLNRLRVLLPHALVLHVNPASLQESFNQKKEIIQTRGGFVEQHWGSDLSEISADATTGAFMNIYTGLTSVLRQRTIAWDRYRDLVDLFYNNGSVRDPFGAIVLQGHVMLMYDRGTYIGTFRDFSVEEGEEAPFSFNLSWTFKVEYTVSQVSSSITRIGLGPRFQGQNLPTSSGVTGT